MMKQTQINATQVSSLRKVQIITDVTTSGFSFLLSLEFYIFVISIPARSLCQVEFPKRYLGPKLSFTTKLSLPFKTSTSHFGHKVVFNSFPSVRISQIFSIACDLIHSQIPAVCSLPSSTKVRGYIFLCRRSIISTAL